VASSRFAVAVHTLALLARAEGQPLDSRAIAHSVNTNPVVIRRALCALARARVIRVRRGAGGGAALARAPHEITLLDIYRAVNGGAAFALHPAPQRRCPVGRSIHAVLCWVQDEIDAAVQRTLAEITLQDVVDRLQTGRRPTPTRGRKR